MPVLSYREAVAQALQEALDEDDRVFLMGEDIGPYGGAFAVTRGFWEKYGQRRISPSPEDSGRNTGSAGSKIPRYPNLSLPAPALARPWPG